MATVRQESGQHGTVRQESGQHGTVRQESGQHGTEHDKYYKLWNSAIPYKTNPKKSTVNDVACTTKSRPLATRSSGSQVPLGPRNTKKRCGSCAVVMDIERFPVHQKPLNFGWCRSCCATNISEPPISTFDSLYDDDILFIEDLESNKHEQPDPIDDDDDDDDDEL
jgi:hypothetical protein